MSADVENTCDKTSIPIAARADALMERQFRARYRIADRWFALLLGLEWILCLLAALAATENASETPAVHRQVAFTAAVGALLCGLPAVFSLRWPGRALTRHSIAIGQLLTSALWTHLAEHRFESFLLMFASIALMTTYLDRRVLWTATGTAVAGFLAHLAVHFSRIPDVEGADVFAVAELGGWLAFEVVFLSMTCRWGRATILALAAKQAELEIGQEAAKSDSVRQAAALEASEAQSNAILESAHQAILTFDKSGRIRVFNAATIEFFQRTPNELVGQSIWELFATPFADSLSRQFEKQTSDPNRGPLRWNRDLVATRHEGETFPVSISVSETRIGDDPLFAVICRDATNERLVEAMMSRYVDELVQSNHEKSLHAEEMSRLVEELKVARQKADEANQSKRVFLANISHEMRTPMTGIIGMTDLALSTSLSDEQREYLETTRSSAESLLELINDLLDFSKIEAGRLELCPASFRLRDVLAAMVGPLAMRAHQKGLDLVCRVAPDVPENLIGDDLRLRQVLINLLGNAVKFTEKGEVFLDCSLKSFSSDQATLRFSVRDTGIGIAPDAMERIFQPFAQADASTARIYGGTGLGLMISSRLARLMGGEIEVESEPGKGSVFSFSATMRRGAGRTEEREVRVPCRATAVLLTTSASLRSVVSELLARGGIETHAFEDGEEAKQWIGHRSEADRLSSLLLVDGDWGESTAFWQGNETAIRSMLGVIVLKSRKTHRSDQTLETVPRRQTIFKPVFEKSLWHAVQQLLPCGPTLVSRTPEATSLATIDPEMGIGRRILIADDNSVNCKVAGRFLEMAGYSVDVVGDGELAVNAVRRTPYDAVFMDLQMPRMNGVEATQNIRKIDSAERRAVPIIAMTASALVDDRDMCLDAGMNGYITKPLRADWMLAELKSVLRPRPGADAQRMPRDPEAATVSQDDVGTQPATADSPERATADDAISGGLARLVEESAEPVERSPSRGRTRWVDWNTLRAQTGNDDEFLRELVELFLGNSQSLMKELDSAISEGNEQDAYRTAHSLKGILGSMTKDEPYRLVLKLEELGRGAAHAGLKTIWPQFVERMNELREELLRPPIEWQEVEASSELNGGKNGIPLKEPASAF